MTSTPPESTDSGQEFIVTGRPGEVEVLLLGLLPGDDGPTLVGGEILGPAAEAILASLIAVGATGKTDKFTRIPTPPGSPVASIAAIGLGSAEPDDDAVRWAAGVAARNLAGVASVATTLSLLAPGPTAEGFHLGGYTFTAFKTAASYTAKPETSPVELIVTDPQDPQVADEVRRALAVARATTTARDLVNTPPSHLYPAAFAERAAQLAAPVGVEVEILDEATLATEGYGGIFGVGQGSVRPPRLVRLTYRSAAADAKTVALVGKGVTFDTGGISIKPAAGMENMTSDMAGAAAVIAATLVAAALALDVTVIATVPIAENMPSGTAIRPGDVLTHLDGSTVEVINTDAEGRLILADALVRAARDEPDYVIDAATLTGAQMIALGTRTPGVLGTPEFRDRVAALSQEVGENAWPMPLPAHLKADLDSKIADRTNVTPHRYGGMLSAGWYLRQFVPESIPWVHLDVAGPAYNTGGPYGYTPKGATGVPVRTIVAVLEDIAAETAEPEESPTAG
ncbi:leucyl aminopeptidase [Millisia brevis]|uniref:leucyl aminopeptidase n=1 Tax=Millisia brevis TaxID=264148 RepID=UPI000A6E1C42